MAECFAKSKFKIFVEQNMLFFKEWNRPFLFQMFVQFEKCISPVSMILLADPLSTAFMAVSSSCPTKTYKINLVVILCHPKVLVTCFSAVVLEICNVLVNIRLLIFLTNLINAHLVYPVSYPLFVLKGSKIAEIDGT